MNDMNKTVREFYKAVEGVKTKKTGGYDVQATVRRVEDGVAWVHIPDGVDETPAKLTINAKEGDVVQVRVVNGRAFLVGNASAPPTDNTEAIKALSQADVAAQAATIARLKAKEATTDAARAHAAADAAQESADDAAQAASDAMTAAGNAQTSATTANTAANNALQGLSTVESVVDVVNWFNEHKTASTDTTVDPSKTYYSYDAQTGALTKLDPDGTENPSALGWYEMSDAVAGYVATHVATTADGLSVLSAANGWRVLISSGGGSQPAGIFLIDPNGNIAQQTTINGVEFNTGRAVKIGDQTAYINFDGNGNISVVGANMTIGGANNISGVLTVLDASGNTIGTLDKNGINTIAGTIGGWNISSSQLRSDVTINNTKHSAVMQKMDGTNLDRLAFFVGEYANGSSTMTSTPFSVNYAGKLHAEDAYIAGTISANSGTIGGFDISSTQLRSDVTVSGTKYSAVMQSMDSSASTSRFAFAVVEYANGSTTFTDIPFRVNYDGSLLSTKGTIGGWGIQPTYLGKTTADGNYRMLIQAPDAPTTGNWAIRLDNLVDGTWTNKFHLSYGGELYAIDASINGSVTTVSGNNKFILNTGTLSGYYANNLVGALSIARSTYDLRSVIQQLDPVIQQQLPFTSVTASVLKLTSSNSVGFATGNVGEIDLTTNNGNCGIIIKDVREYFHLTGGVDLDVARWATPSLTFKGNSVFTDSIRIQRSTSNGDSFDTANPQIQFCNSNASQNLALSFTDYDSVQSPASLTLVGNQGGEYFIAPNIKIKDGGLTVAHSDSSKTSVRLQNNNHDGSFAISSSGYLMLWSVTNQASLIQMGVDGITKVRCPNGMYRPVGSVDTDGQRVGVFATPSATTLRVYAQKGAAGASYGEYITFTGTSSSDIRLKRNIKPVEVKALPLINSIEMKSFDWIPGQRDYKHQPIGMIADQIERLDSRLVMGGGYDSDGTPNYKVIDDHYLICYLTKAVQELSAEIERMKAS